MKRFVLLMLAVVMVGMAGCHKSHDDSIILTLVLNANCGAEGYAAGHIANVETGYQTETISIWPGQSLTIELPESGLYRFYFETYYSFWDFTKQIDGDYTQFLSCQ